MPSATAPAICDLAVVGGGILGLAVAREMLLRHPGAHVCVLEREESLGEHQSSQNSGVIHTGIYYTPGSLKAKLCVAGAKELYEYCEQRALAHERCGKLIIACDRSELPGLQELERRGAANGVADLELLDAKGLERYEPHAQGLAALYSPHTGIVDFKAVAHAYASDLLEAGGTVITGCEVLRTSSDSRSITLLHSHGATQASHALFCAGAWSDRLASAAGAPADPRIIPFRGTYMRLKSSREHLVRSLIYPVPDPALPFLGVHLTRSMDKGVLIGPTALLSLRREANASGMPRPRDVLDTLTWPGTWRMSARFWRTGLHELRHAANGAALVKAASRYVPELEPTDVQSAFAGVRAQALHRDGRLVDDFVFSHTERALHLRNAPSPAATSSLSIARHVVDELERTKSFSLRFAGWSAARP